MPIGHCLDFSEQKSRQLALVKQRYLRLSSPKKINKMFNSAAQRPAMKSRHFLQFRVSLLRRKKVRDFDNLRNLGISEGLFHTSFIFIIPLNRAEKMAGSF